MSVQAYVADMLRDQQDEENDPELVRLTPRIDPASYATLEQVAGRLRVSKTKCAAQLLEAAIDEAAAMLHMIRSNEQYEALVIDRVGTVDEDGNLVKKGKA